MITKCCLVLVAVAVTICSALPMPDERQQQYEPHQPQFQPHEPQYQSQPQPQEAQHQPQFKSDPYKADPYKEPSKPYAFDYGVRDDYSGANYGHSETSNGNSVEGSYQVALPDGRIQIVKYVADHENGFQAQVEYEGEARYPEYVPPKEPSYKPEPYKQPPPQQYKPHKPQPHKQQPHKPSYKSEPQFHPNEPQQIFHEAQEAPIYHAEDPEYN